MQPIMISSGQHQLPPLPYPYNALEPVISERTLKIHHDRHHKAYVDGLNRAEINLSNARKRNDYEYIKYWEMNLHLMAPVIFCTVYIGRLWLPWVMEANLAHIPCII